MKWLQCVDYISWRKKLEKFRQKWGYSEGETTDNEWRYNHHADERMLSPSSFNIRHAKGKTLVLLVDLFYAYGNDFPTLYVCIYVWCLHT